MKTLTILLAVILPLVCCYTVFDVKDTIGTCFSVYKSLKCISIWFKNPMCPVLIYMHDCTNGYGFIQVLAVAQRMCNTGSDCNSDECCVSNNPPRGRRFLETHSHLGHCVPMGTDGSSKVFCVVSSQFITPC